MEFRLLRVVESDSSGSGAGATSALLISLGKDPWLVHLRRAREPSGIGEIGTRGAGGGGGGVLKGEL
jgi:hypothetical protein